MQKIKDEEKKQDDRYLPMEFKSTLKPLKKDLNHNLNIQRIPVN